MPFTRRAFLVASATLASVASAGAEDVGLLPSVLGTTELRDFDTMSGLGLGGTDPVSYFVDEAPSSGLVSIETIWGGIAWRFGSQANRAAFLRDPEAFLPRIGGYDALAAVSGRVVGASPLV